jgi:hypothetical protein
MIVQVEVRNVYGVKNIYPVNHAARVFAFISGRKTLTRAVLEDIKLLGYTIEQVHTNDLEELA